jgi:hypothetical protein
MHCPAAALTHFSFVFSADTSFFVFKFVSDELAAHCQKSAEQQRQPILFYFNRRANDVPPSIRRWRS